MNHLTVFLRDKNILQKHLLIDGGPTERMIYYSRR